MDVNNFDHLVAWSNFAQRNERPPGVDEDAAIFPEMIFSRLRMGRVGRCVSISQLDITIRLHRSHCWSVRSCQTNELLKHEQGHFDIVAIGARELHKRLMRLMVNNSRDLRNFMNDIHANFASNIESINTRYDNATNHSLNVAVQRTWDQQIASVKLNALGTLNDLPQAVNVLTQSGITL